MPAPHDETDPQATQPPLGPPRTGAPNSSSGGTVAKQPRLLVAMMVVLAVLVVALGVAVGVLFKEASDLRDDLHRQERQVDSLRFDVDEHSGQIEDLQSSVDDLKSSFDDLDSRVSDLEPPV